MILVDTSVWILDSTHVGFLEEQVASEEVATCLPVIQELLQGARDHEFSALRETLFASHILESPMTVELFEEAIEIYRTGRRLGMTIRSSHDCLIAACAIRNDVPLLHSDRDFAAIARFTRLESHHVAL